MCHSFSPFNHELSCNSLNSPWHQTKLKVSVLYTHTKYIHTYIHTYIQWNAANKKLYFLKFGKIDSYLQHFTVCMYVYVKYTHLCLMSWTIQTFTTQFMIERTKRMAHAGSDLRLFSPIKLTFNCSQGIFHLSDLAGWTIAAPVSRKLKWNTLCSGVLLLLLLLLFFGKLFSFMHTSWDLRIWLDSLD